MKIFKNNLLRILLFVFAFLLYANTIPNDYCLDDELVTHGNPQISRGVSAIPEIITSFYEAREGFTYGYRPIVKITFAVEYSLFGWNPHVSHAINALLYALLILLVFAVSQRIFEKGNVVLPFLVSVIFMVHPAHTEVVASLKNRDELIAVLLGFLAILFFLKSTVNYRKINVFTGSMFLLLGLLSKMSILPLVVIIPMILFLKRPRTFSPTDKKNWKAILIEYLSVRNLKLRLKSMPYYIWVLLVLVIVSICFALITLFLPSAESGSSGEYNLLFWQNPLYFQRHWGNWVLTCGATLWFYAKLMLYPFNLAFYYGYNMLPASSGNPWIWISLLLHTAAFLIALRMLIRTKNIGAFGFLFYLLSLSMYANLFAPVAGIVAERLSFLASWGFAVLLVYILLKILRIDLHGNTTPRPKMFLLVGVSLVIIIPFSVQTIKRNFSWKDHLTLFSADIEKLQQSAKANDLMAAAVFRDAQGKFKKNAQDPAAIRLFQKAEKYYSRCAAVYPGHYMTWNNLGLINLSFLGNVARAIDNFEQTVAVNPEFAQGWNNLGYAYFISGRYKEAIDAYTKTTVLNPDSLSPRSSLANVFFKVGDTAQARKINERLMITHPSSPVPFINLATYALKAGDTISALQYFETALMKDPGNENAKSFFNYYKQRHGEKRKTSGIFIN